MMGKLDVELGMCSLTSRYSPQLLVDEVGTTPADLVALIARGAEMTAGIASFALCLARDNLNSTPDSPELVRKRATELRELLTRLGPCFIKMGQVLGSRPDIVRDDYMEELCLLQDDVPAFPDAEAYTEMRAALGPNRRLEDVFSEISARPVAAASLGQVYKATLRDTGEAVAIKVQRPNVAPTIMRDLLIFRSLAWLVNPLARARLGCDAELVVDEFGQKLLEELDYRLEASNIEDFGRNFADDPTVKIPWVRRDLCSDRMLVMEWIDGARCTDPDAVRAVCGDAGVEEFIRVGVVSALRMLLEHGLFHGDPHPGNIFAMPDGRIAYVDFGNVAQLSQANKQTLIDAVVHAVNEDYEEMAGDFMRLGFLGAGTDVGPIVPALEKIWQDSLGQSIQSFNFRSITLRFNELVYQYPIRIPERYSLVIRSLLTQEGICMTLQPNFHFLEVAYPYVARRLLTDEDPALRERLIQVLFDHGRFRWDRLENLVALAGGGGAGSGAGSGSGVGSDAVGGSGQGLDLTDTVKDALGVLLTDGKLRGQLIGALTEGDRLHLEEMRSLLAVAGDGVSPVRLAGSLLDDLPKTARKGLLAWSDAVLRA